MERKAQLQQLWTELEPKFFSKLLINQYQEFLLHKRAPEDIVTWLKDIPEPYWTSTQQNPLHILATQDNEEVVRHVLAIGRGGINQKDNRHVTPFLTACVGYGNLKVSQIFLEAGAIVDNSYYEMQKGPLHFACESCRVDLVKLLIKFGADVNAIDVAHHTPLHQLVQNKMTDYKAQIEIATALLDAGANLEALDFRQRSPFHLSVYGHHEVSLFLLERGARPDSNDAYLETPLLLACGSGRTELAKHLIENGLADINAVDHWSTSPLYQAITSQNYELARCLVEHGASKDTLQGKQNKCLHLAAKKGNIELIDLIITLVPSINLEATYDSLTCLQVAARYGQKEAIMRLLDYGANLSVKDNEGIGLLGYGSEAIFKDMSAEELIDFLKWLISIGCGKKLRVVELKSILKNVVVYADEEFAMPYAERFRRMTTKKSHYSELAAQAAKNARTSKILDFFVRVGQLDVNAYVSSFEMTLLHIAVSNTCSKYSIPCVKYLLRKGANVNTSNEYEGYTTLHTVLSRHTHQGRYECLKLLLQHNADINVMFRGFTPLKLAKEYQEQGTDLTREMIQLVLYTSVWHVQEKPVADENYRVIRDTSELKRTFESAVGELRAMKRTVIQGSLTLFDAMTEPKRYARNAQVVRAIERKNALRIYPVMRDHLMENYEKARKRPRLEERAKGVLAVFAGALLPELCDAIFKYLTNKDLRNLILADNTVTVESSNAGG